jgi:hypothetical protein
MEIVLLIAHFSSVSVLIPLVLAILQWRRLPADIAALRWLIVACAVTDIVSFLSSQVFSVHNQFVGDAYMFFQFTLLLYIFSLQFERKAVLKVAYVSVVVFYLTSLVILKSYSVSTSIFDAITSLVIITLSIIFFYKLLNELKVVNIHRLPILWISFAALFYYSGNLFIFLSRTYLESVPDSYKVIWTAHNILNITKNILFAIALWQSYRTMKSST